MAGWNVGLATIVCHPQPSVQWMQRRQQHGDVRPYCETPLAPLIVHRTPPSTSTNPITLLTPQRCTGATHCSTTPPSTRHACTRSPNRLTLTRDCVTRTRYHTQCTHLHSLNTHPGTKSHRSGAESISALVSHYRNRGTVRIPRDGMRQSFSQPPLVLSTILAASPSSSHTSGSAECAGRLLPCVAWLVSCYGVDSYACSLPVGSRVA